MGLNVTRGDEVVRLSGAGRRDELSGDRGVAPDPKALRFRSRPAATYHRTLHEYKVETADGSGETGLFDLIRQRDTHAGKTPDAYPWITFVLGSGCLATRGADQEGVDLDRFLRVGLEPVGDLVERYALADLAKAFLVDLAALKLQQRPANETLAAQSVTADEAKWPLAARAIVVAALATRLYTEGLNLTTRVLDRAEREQVTYSIDAPEMARLHAGITQPLLKLISPPVELRSDAAHSHRAWKHLATEVASRLEATGSKTILRSHVELLTAFAWLFATADADIYPGWSDVLLFQAADMADHTESFAAIPALSRPDLRNVAPLSADAWIHRLLRAVTERSWAQTDTARDSFYDSVAALLVQQAELRTTSPDANIQWPLATAFVASFDVELEIALISQLRAGADSSAGSFAVVLPVFLIDDSPAAAPFDTTLHWLWRRVGPFPASEHGGELGDLLDGGGWQLLDGVDVAGELGDLPIVVHLSGGPLFTLPEKSDRDFLTHGRLRHALLLDENMALVQVAADLAGRTGRLPRDFTRDSGVRDVGSRFWTFIGTQLADSGIRLRLVSQELATLLNPESRISDATHARRSALVESASVELSDEADAIGDQKTEEDTEPRADRVGLIVNDWAPATERQVFHWQGLDVVKARNTELVSDFVGMKQKVDEQRAMRSRDGQETQR